jgi:hypothetical protein
MCVHLSGTFQSQVSVGIRPLVFKMDFLHKLAIVINLNLLFSQQCDFTDYCYFGTEVLEIGVNVDNSRPGFVNLLIKL